ncbi:DUF58 domain-containing protein [Limnoraphis robusta Tam1]|uniref:DUF58 domain-containing protein n=1 Tax=Limnoraphis robusta TaxID=1118279 RepID=UPI002B2194DE|nr:DUF58 domain-containing protein [Limnoraphis robusta]MEA5542523.1 DUF58 domain-containing protein [Limnoraphis robusta Tam1]
MKIHQKIGNWLERRWIAPAYAGGLLTFLSLFFFGAATNTMAGWLYVISGTSFALLAIAAVLPVRSLKPLEVHRRPIEPVSVGNQLTIELEIDNRSEQPKTLLQVYDQLPSIFGKSATAIEALAPRSAYHWVYYLPTERRGVYHWEQVQLRTATPLGLFWCRRSREAKATAIVYPTVLPLTTCPLVDQMGWEQNQQVLDRSQYNMATEGVTRTLRPYRYGDPTRLIHWRSSARYNQLRVRELEVATGGQEIVICLDSGSSWQSDNFEQAVIAAASLYFYASRSQLNVQLWTAQTGLVRGNRVVLSTLAAVNASEEAIVENFPNIPVIWLTQNSPSIFSLASGSRWVLWSEQGDIAAKNLSQFPQLGLQINRDQPLQLQLQSSLK